MATDTSFLGQLRMLAARVRKLETGIPLQNSAVTKGMVRFIGAVLRLEAGSLLDGIGTFRWRGPGSIAGDFEVLEGGVIRVGGVLISPVGGGRIMIGPGPSGIILDGGAGALTMGNIRLEGGKIYVGTGASQIVIDGATGKITANGLTIDPSANGGKIKYVGGPEVYASGSQLGLYSIPIGAYITLDGVSAKILGPGLARIEVTSSQIFLQGATPTTVTAAGGQHKPGAYIRLANGALGYVVPD